MYVAILVAMLNTGELHTEISANAYDKPACEELLVKTEEMVRQHDDIVAFAAKCVEIRKEDVQRGGRKV